MDQKVEDGNTLQVASAGMGAAVILSAREISSHTSPPYSHSESHHFLTMYSAELHPESGFLYRDMSMPVHKQLLLNYCFGHAESTSLIFYAPIWIIDTLD